MSTQYPGGFITKSPVAPTTTAASGIWTVDQALQYVKAGTWPQPPSQFIEDWFSTYLYTGNGTSQTITNGINLSTNSGLVWTKRRVNTVIGNTYHILTDTVRGATKQLYSNDIAAQATNANMITAFNTTGYAIGSDGNVNYTNASPQTYVSWTFAKRANFFDIVTYTGDGTSNRAINHNLGSVPGFITTKILSTTSNWNCYHRSISPVNNNTLALNKTDSASAGGQDIWGNGSTVTVPTSTNFYVGAGNNTNGATYVAYLFAHDAGGFGASGSENVISCGSLTTNASGVSTVNLGYEPQWIMIKSITAAEDWFIFDVMRGFAYGSVNPLKPNLDEPEGAFYPGLNPTATGFASSGTLSPSSTYIYIAIRRGPMKTPTVGTSVFAPVVQASASPTLITTNFPVDMSWMRASRASVNQIYDLDRLRGNNKFLETTTSNDEQTYSGGWNFQSNVGVNDVAWSSSGAIWWNFQRAPGFFDEVCYTGTGSVQNLTHNLTVVPEMMIGKSRSGVFDWCVYHKDVGNTKAIYLNGSGTPVTSLDFWNNTTPTASVFTIGTINRLNTNGNTQVMYLFATVAGVSKVGSYTGTAALQTVNCGFTTGARFVLIKRTDVAGGWYTYDSARGITSGNDPYLLLNSTAAEVTGTNYVDTDTTGFKVTAAAPAELNASGGNYIFLAIA